MKYLIVLALTFFISAAYSQEVKFEIVITDKDRITDFDNGVPIFDDSNINDIFSNYNVSYFAKAYALSEYEYLHRYYEVICDSIGLAEELVIYDSILFPSYFEINAPKVLGYIPQDWGSSHNDTDLFKFLKAPDAWEISKGDTNTIIGITDTYFDVFHEDLQGKFANIRSNTHVPSTSEAHGTFVSGLIAAETDNDTFGVTGMGFNCRLNVSTKMSNIDEILRMVKDTIVNTKIYNGSWAGSPTQIPNYYWAERFGYNAHQGIMQELYELGVVTIFSAGNGKTVTYPSDVPYTYEFPASYDHVLSISSVGHLNITGTTNIRYYHEKYLGDSIASEGTHQHNSRVDLCAPGYDISSLYHKGGVSKDYSYREFSGTSFAAPLVAGTVGLMRSKIPWLTPYQIEYVLKKSSVDIYNRVYNGVAYNQKYAGATRWTGRLGAGALNAGAALDTLDVDSFIADHPDLSTFRILGFKINTLCVPGSHSGVDTPEIEVLLENGTPPYRYKWQALSNNNVYISNQYDSIGNSTKIISKLLSKRSFSLPWIMEYRLTVYDNSEIEKVATRAFRIDFTDESKWILAMQDAYADIYDEPNRMLERSPLDWDIWTSPDLWNRHAQDGDTIHQNPDTTATNYMHVRIKNVGCISSPNDPDSANVKLYWTLASTGEHWPDDWLGIPKINGNDVGGLINAGGTAIPALAPGQDTILSEPWIPPNPHDFDTTGTVDTIDVCALARIETQSFSPYGMIKTESDTTKINVLNNNKIVTKNFVSLNLSQEKQTRPTGVIVGGQGSSGQGIYTLQIITQNQLQPFIAGHLGSYMQATLHLGGLYDEWDAGGKEGNPSEYDDVAKTVTWDMEEELRLENITLDYDERYYIIIEYGLKPDTPTIPYDINNYLVHLRLISPETVTIDNGDGTTFDVLRDYVHSAVNYSISIESSEGEIGELKPKRTNISETLLESKIDVYPNPAKNLLIVHLLDKDIRATKVTVTNISGEVIFYDDNAVFNNRDYIIKTGGYAPGMYFVNVTNALGQVYIKRFVKIE